MDAWLHVAAGLAFLTLGGEGVIRGAVGIARRLGLSELLIGLVLVGFGTSTPELLTSVNAALAGSPGIAIGNVVGSNIGNILLIFAVVALIRPIDVHPDAVARDATIALGVSALLAALAVALGSLDRFVGFLLVAGLVAYIAVVWRVERRGGAAAAMHAEESHTHDPAPAALWLSALFAFGGLALLILGADLLVEGAIALAHLAGLSETVIGLTIVAVGTSLPELVASLVAALKGKADVAFGNIVGSNIYNILGILGITALVHPVEVPADMGAIDWLALIGSAALLLFNARTGWRVTRPEAVVLLALYVLYVWSLLAR